MSQSGERTNKQKCRNLSTNKKKYKKSKSTKKKHKTIM